MTDEIVDFVLPETETYFVRVEESPTYERPVYRIVNRFTHVVEYENPVFANICEVIGALEQSIIDIADEDEEPDLGEGVVRIDRTH